MVSSQANGRRLTTLINTDWCADHTGSNESIGAIGAQIIAHEHTKQYLANDQFVEWQKRTYKAKPASALPNKTFYTKGTIAVGTERLEYGHLGQAHTDGDIYVHLPASNVLVAGDVLSVGRYPIADYTTGGWLGGMVTATKTLIDLSNAETRVIPGTGPVQTRADLQAQYEMLNTMRDRLAKMMRQGMSAKDMLAAAATKDFDEKWGDPSLFLPVTYRGMWLHVRELGGIV
jgi:glyoxylase-like metal-dependent hydrolase (beta-lactamase superfamily II)